MTDSYRIFLREFTGLLQIGIHDFEKKAPQPYKVSVSLEVAHPTSWDDRIECYFNYDAIHEDIRELFTKSYATQEFFARQVAQACLRHREIMRADVTVEKPTVYQECLGVGVSISLQRPTSPTE